MTKLFDEIKKYVDAADSKVRDLSKQEHESKSESGPDPDSVSGLISQLRKKSTGIPQLDRIIKEEQEYLNTKIPKIIDEALRGFYAEYKTIIDPGDRVVVRRHVRNPSRGWGNMRPGAIGTVRSVEDNRWGQYESYALVAYLNQNNRFLLREIRVDVKAFDPFPGGIDVPQFEEFVDYDILRQNIFNDIHGGWTGDASNSLSASKIFQKKLNGAERRYKLSTTRNEFEQRRKRCMKNARPY